MIFNSLATADELHTDTTYKAIMQDFKSLCSCNYRVKDAFSDGKAPEKCTVVILNKSAEPTFNKKSWFPRQMLGLPGKVPGYWLKFAPETTVWVTKVVKSKMTLGKAAIYVENLVAESHAVDVFIGTVFIDTYIRGISQERRGILTRQDGRAGILPDVPGKEDGKPTAAMQDQNVNVWSPTTGLLRTCRVCRTVALRPKTKISVVRRSDKRGLVVLGLHEILLILYQRPYGQSVAGITSGCLLHILLINQSDWSIQEPMVMILPCRADVLDLRMAASRWGDDSVYEMCEIAISNSM